MKIFQIARINTDVIPYAFMTTDDTTGLSLQSRFWEATIGQLPSIQEGFIPPAVFADRALVRSNSEQTPDIDELLGSDGLIFSARAALALAPLLERHGELLPVTSHDELKLYYCHTFLSPFIGKETYTTRPPSPIVKIHAFDESKVLGIDIFKSIHDPRKIYVSEKFKSSAEEHDLKSNLAFPLVWDSENPDFWDETWDREMWERVKSTKEILLRRLDASES